MVWIFGLVAAVFGLGFLALVAAYIVRVVSAVIKLLVRLSLALVLAVGVGVVVGMLAGQNGADGALTGVFVALLAFLPALELVERRPAGPARLPKVVFPAAELPSLAALEPFEAAWATARGLAPRNALEGAQEASMRLLQLVDRHGSFDPELVDYAVTLRRHGPALVSETEELLATADRVERRVAVAALVEDLVRLGQGASDLLAQQGFSARERLAVRRARLFGAGRAV